MRSIFILLTIFVCFTIQGQNQIFIKSKNTNQSIPYANIWESNKIFTSSDSLGSFFIGEKYLNSKFKVSAVGYKTMDSIIINDRNTIYLEEDIIELKEISVSKRINSKNFKIGKVKNGDIGIVAEMNRETSQIGKFFVNNSSEKLFLDRFRFKTNCSSKNQIVNILIYSVGDNGEPYEIINTENIVCKLKKGYNTNEVDLRDLKIEFPVQGVFIVVNYLFLEQNKVYGKKNKNWYYYEPSLDALLVNQYTDTWYNDNNDWKKNNNCSVSFQLIVTN
jgi:hypothetical protein